MKRLALLLLVACSAPESSGVDSTNSTPPVTAPAIVPSDVDTGVIDAGVDVATEAEIDAEAKDAGADSTTDGLVPDVAQPVDAGPRLPPRAFVYGESHADRPAFTSKLSMSLGANWVTSAKGRPSHTMSELYFTAPTDLAAVNAETGRARKVLVVFAGTNDYYRASTPVEFVCEQWKQFTSVRSAEGWSVVLLTPLRSDLANQQAPVSVRHAALRTCIMADGVTWGAAAVVDVGGDSALQNPLDGVYFESPIGTHLTTAGYEYAAGLVAPAVQALYVAP